MIGDQTNDAGAALNAGTACIILYENQPPGWKDNYPENVIFCHHRNCTDVIRNTVIKKSSVINE